MAKKKSGVSIRILVYLLAIVVVASGFFLWKVKETKINGLIYLIQSDAADTADGILKWETELNKRGLTSLIKLTKPVMEKYPQLFKKLADEGHVLIGGYPGVCWDVPYEEQYKGMKETKEYMEKLTGKPMEVFGCTYFSYDENTVKAAHELGIPYLLARGTEDVRAFIYKPKEYNVKLLEISNVEFTQMGRGSLCDVSLFSRGATEADFEIVYEESVAKKPDSMILVSHPHIGGVKEGYWKVYEKALASDKVVWRPFNEWIKEVKMVELSYKDIPENREVEYLEPAPAVPLQQLKNLPDVGRKILMFHNGQGPMCVEAKEFFADIDFPFEEHLNTEKGFIGMLDEYRAKYPSSVGESDSYGYFPIIFIGNKSFSGFNDEIKQMILKEVERIK